VPHCTSSLEEEYVRGLALADAARYSVRQESVAGATIFFFQSELVVVQGDTCMEAFRSEQKSLSAGRRVMGR
jgi:hypothetical protein